MDRYLATPCGILSGELSLGSAWSKSEAEALCHRYRERFGYENTDASGPVVVAYPGFGYVILLECSDLIDATASASLIIGWADILFGDEESIVLEDEPATAGA